MTNLATLPIVSFSVVMTIVLIGWLALILFPTRHWSNFWLAGVIVPLTLCLFYMFFLVVYWFQQPPGDFSDFFSLSGVYHMFGNNGLLLTAWLDILAMDVVVGAWMTRKAAQVRMPYVYLLPCLILTFAFAGFGYTLFCITMSFGERWKAIYALEQMKPIPPAVFPAIPAGAEVTS
jgi:hypothetical protein